MAKVQPLEKRLADLLQAVVDEYVVTGEPVGSQYLVERQGMDVSPATIRNWFAELEELGYLVQPHTSGGRLPTEKGYRAYVELFVQPRLVQKREREMLDRAICAEEEAERRYKQAARALSDLSGLAVVLSLGTSDTFYTGLSLLFAQPEFKQWQRVVSLTGLLDHLDETLQTLRRARLTEVRVLIGRECPFGTSCSAVIAQADEALIGILGPLRMDYQRAYSLIATSLSLLTH